MREQPTRHQALAAVAWYTAARTRPSIAADAASAAAFETADAALDVLLHHAAQRGVAGHG